MLFLAPVLSLGSDRPERDTKTFFKGTEAFLERLGTFVMGRRKTFIVLSAFSVLVGFWGLSKVEVDIKAMEMMGMKMPHIQDQSYISQSPIGVNFSYSIALDFSREDEVLNPEILNRVDELTDFIYKTPYIKRVTSINDVVKEINRIRHRDDPAYYVIPEKASLLRGLLSYTRRISGDSVKLLLNEDNSVLRIMVEINDVSTSAMVDHIDEVKAEIDRLFPPSEFEGMEHLMAGSVIQMSEMNQHITKGLVRSVVLALIVISIMMMIVFKSFKLGLISMIPNISPVIIAGGVMGFMGESLEFVTMTIAPMIMGLAVDDTIHFINHVRVEFSKSRSYDLAIQNSFIKVGKAMTQATLILCVTFLMFTTSIAHSMVNMGLYINIGMLTALIADFTITPILIKLSKPFGKES